VTVNVAPDIFIGLVTHPKSVFPQARTANGLAARLVETLTSLGLVVASTIVDDNPLARNQITVSPKAVRASIREEITVEEKWREYLNSGSISRLMQLQFRIRQIATTLRLAPPWRRSIDASDAGSRRLIRLANIELAHLRVLDEAVRSESAWALILEDDAQADDASTLGQELAQFLSSAPDATPELSMINLSDSFTVDQLGIEHLLAEGAETHTWRVRKVDRHITNTVCAVLYRRDLLVRLLEELQSIPLEPVIPIDFKVNEAIRRAGSDLPGQTWMCDPAPIAQGSGVPAASTVITR